MAAQPTPADLLAKAVETYKSLKSRSYIFELTESNEFSGEMRNRTELKWRIAGNGSRYREKALPNGLEFAFDGQFAWQYFPGTQEYSRQQTSGGTPARLASFQLLTFRLKQAQWLRKETMTLSSGPVECDVIAAEYEIPKEQGTEAPRLYWIDAQRGLVLKMHSERTTTSSDSIRKQPTVSRQTLTFLTARLDEPVDESLVRFTPPPGAQEVSQISFGPKSNLVGTDSPEFTLQSSNGETLSSAVLKGRAILLQFGPVEDTAALFWLEMMHRALRDRGLTAVYVCPSARRSGEFTVPIAADRGKAVARSFGVSYSGMVLIDRNGKIAYADASIRNIEALHRALQAIGIW